MNDQAPISLLILSDGRPGHYRQSEAIVMAIARRRKTIVNRIELPPPAITPLRLAKYAALWLPPSFVMRRLYGVNIEVLSRPNLIISAGGQTLAANVALARHFNVPNMYSGTPKHLGGKRFKLVLSPYLSAASQPNTAYALKPCALDPDNLPVPKLFAGHDFNFRIALLIGGPIASAKFEKPDWLALAQLMKEFSRVYAVRFVLVTSRRTPIEAYEAFDPLLTEQGIVDKFIDHRRAGSGSIAEAYAADAIWATLDSMSMVSEGCAARRPTIALAPAKTAPCNDDEAISSLASERRIALVKIHQTDAAHMATAMKSTEPMKQNHLDELAHLVLTATRL